MSKSQEIRRRGITILKEFNSNFQFGYKNGTTIKNGQELLKYLLDSKDEDASHAKSRLERADAHMLSAINFYISSCKSLESDDYLMFDISLYYSVFNLHFLNKAFGHHVLNEVLSFLGF